MNNLTIPDLKRVSKHPKSQPNQPELHGLIRSVLQYRPDPTLYFLDDDDSNREHWEYNYPEHYDLIRDYGSESCFFDLEQGRDC